MRKWNLFAAAVICGPLLYAPLTNAAPVLPGTFNQPGNILISDQFNNRVIEIDKRGDIVWSWGLGPHDFSANSPLGVNGGRLAIPRRRRSARRALPRNAVLLG